MPDNERSLIRWLTTRCSRRSEQVTLGIGDDMAIVAAPGGSILLTCDLLLDGVHFDTGRHSLREIGRKVVACSLSDCAAMAVRPLAAVASVAFPRAFSLEQARQLMDAIAGTCEAYECELIGGDTTSWVHPLAVDVSMLAVSYPDIPPVRRDGAQAGDGVFVTGPLGGSLLEHHMTFEPRVRQAKIIAETLGRRLRAMIDISDGLSLDLDRIAEASGLGATLDERSLGAVTRDDARRAAEADGRTVLEHVLADGEDFELLLTADIESVLAEKCGLYWIGVMTAENGLRLRAADGRLLPLEPRGYQHL